MNTLRKHVTAYLIMASTMALGASLNADSYWRKATGAACIALVAGKKVTGSWVGGALCAAATGVVAWYNKKPAYTAAPQPTIEAQFDNAIPGVDVHQQGTILGEVNTVKLVSYLPLQYQNGLPTMEGAHVAIAEMTGRINGLSATLEENLKTIEGLEGYAAIALNKKITEQKAAIADLEHGKHLLQSIQSKVGFDAYSQPPMTSELTSLLAQWNAFKEKPTN